MSFEFLFDGLTALGTFGVAVVAAQGLQSWRAQHTYQQNVDLGRRFLIALQSYTRALDKVRSKEFSHAECAPFEGVDDPFHGLGHVWFFKEHNAYLRRFSALDEMEDKLIVLFDEAAALWGGEACIWLSEVTKFGKELSFFIAHKMRSENPELSEEQREDSSQKIVHLRDIQFAPGGELENNDHDDEFRSELERALNALKDRVRQKML